MQAVYSILLLSYPLILHAGIYKGKIFPVVIYLCFLLALPVITAAFKREKPNFRAWVALMLAIALLFFLPGNDEQLVKLIPLFIYSVLIWVFASTLSAGHTPLVTRLASLMRDEMPAAVIVYTRKATVAWVLYFFTMLTISIFLAVYASIETWSFFNNILSYVFLVSMFLLEFAVRRRVLSEYVDYSFFEFIRRMKNVNFGSVFRK